MSKTRDKWHFTWPCSNVPQNFVDLFNVPTDNYFNALILRFLSMISLFFMHSITAIRIQGQMISSMKLTPFVGLFYVNSSLL